MRGSSSFREGLSGESDEKLLLVVPNGLSRGRSGKRSATWAAVNLDAMTWPSKFRIVYNGSGMAARIRMRCDLPTNSPMTGSSSVARG